MSPSRKKDSQRNILPAQDISSFCEEISLLMQAGIPLADGMELLLEDAGSKRERELLGGLRDRLENHVDFSAALQQSGMFPSYVVKMAEIGEKTGFSDRIMEGLARYYAKESEIFKSLKSALLYPLLMAFVMLAVLFVLSVKVMPVFEGVFLQLGVTLSPLTREIVRWVGIVSGAGLLLVALAAAAFLVFRLLGGRNSWERFSTGRLSELIGEYRTEEVISLSLRSGLDADQGMSLSADICGNQAIRRKLLACGPRMQAGDSFFEAVKGEKLFSAMDRQMIQVGFNAGKLDDTMEKLAKNSEAAIDDRLNGMLAKIEPILVTAMSVVAGGILLLVMLPLIEILSSIG